MDAKISVSAALNACVKSAIAVAVIGVFSVAPARADNLIEILPYVVDNHDRIRASEARLSAARNRAREALGAWFPTLSQTANYGYEKQFNDNGDDTATSFNEWDLSLTQMLWDFGSTNAAIDKARLQVEEARFSLIETRQALILEAITAYVNVRRAYQNLEFADESEGNIREQTGLEEALVELGSGFSTDVLQAKTQLAGAQARKAQNNGALVNALNRYRAVFGRLPESVEDLINVPYPASYLPTALKQAVDIALEANPSLKNAILARDIAREDVRIAKADNFFPVIEGTAERKFKKNVSGTLGSEQETLAKVEMTFDLNLGLTAINTLKASEEDLSASTFSAADTRRNIEEQVRNAWQQLETAQQTASHLNNQANIANAFLELARSERQLGRRSLIDVLSGETNLINARSDALSAETDVLLAAYGLLAATGQLEYDVLKVSTGTNVPQYNATSVTETPSPLPVAPPVLRTRPIESGSLSPDLVVATERSARDFQTMMAKEMFENEQQVAKSNNSAAIELASLHSNDDHHDVFSPTEELTPPIDIVISNSETSSVRKHINEAVFEYKWPEPVQIIEEPDFVSALSKTVVVAHDEPLTELYDSMKGHDLKPDPAPRNQMNDVFNYLGEAKEEDRSTLAAVSDDQSYGSNQNSTNSDITANQPSPSSPNIFTDIFEGFFSAITRGIETSPAGEANDASVVRNETEITIDNKFKSTTKEQAVATTTAKDALNGFFSFLEDAHQRQIEAKAMKAARNQFNIGGTSQSSGPFSSDKSSRVTPWERTALHDTSETLGE